MAAASIACHPSGPPFANIGTLQCGLGVLVHGATKQPPRKRSGVFETSAGRHFDKTASPSLQPKPSNEALVSRCEQAIGPDPWGRTGGQRQAHKHWKLVTAFGSAKYRTRCKPTRRRFCKLCKTCTTVRGNRGCEKMEARSGHTQSWMYTFSWFIPHACVRWPRFLKLAGFLCQFGSVRTLDV